MPPCASWGIAPLAGRSPRRGKFKTVGVAMFNITGTGNLDRMRALPLRPTNMAMPSPLLK